MEDKIQEALAGLKDFQVKTVNYVYGQLYEKGKDRMLIADEVGLGKTIVAKGLIAKAFQEHLSQKPEKKSGFNVVYICSNMALAAQNIKKLNFLHEQKYVNETVNRLIYLAYQPKGSPPPFLIHSLTPGTSFDEKSHQGTANERAILFCLLAYYAPFENRWNGLKWLLKGSISNIESWNSRIDHLWERRHESIRQDLFKIFKDELKSFQVTHKVMPRLYAHLNAPEHISLWHALMKICGQINGYNHHQFIIRTEIVSTLRRILSKKCLNYLNADVFILDEFQRYSDLIRTDEEANSPAIELARTIFGLKGSKILMLSATPFKPFTNEFDELQGEVHYSEFKTVLKFLMKVEDQEFWEQFEKDRKQLFGYLRHPDRLKGQMEVATSLKNKLEQLYRSAIVRTEKLLVSEQKDALIKQMLNGSLKIQPEDINDFIHLDRITQLINKDYHAALPIPIEYVKSCPYPFTFLDNYQHKEKIRQLAGSDESIKKLLKQSGHAWLNLKDIEKYRPLISTKGKATPNAKLRLLLDETVLKKGWQYLWVPPSIPYYALQGAFSDGASFSKTLIFSSWKMVPKMIASLVSYEAERLSVGDKKTISEKEATVDKRLYFEKRRSPRPQFTFKVEKQDNEPQQMNSFILTYPCLFLAELYDPASNVTEKRSFKEIRISLKNKLIKLFKSLKPNEGVSGKGDWQKWYWYAPLFLDKMSENAALIEDWFNDGIPPSELSIDAESSRQDHEEGSGRSKHFLNARQFYTDSLPNIGRLNDEQLHKICDHLADLALGAPAICYLRSQKRYMELGSDLLNASFNVASAFLTLFNKPESIAIIRLHTSANDYWKRVLDYCVDGNLQAVLDEFIYLLIKGENISSTSELSDFISDILSVRTASHEVEDLPLFFKNLQSDKKVKRTMRSHYAVDFGNQKLFTASGSNRQINIRQAFNSPFRPFVLASTSVGQEGLDFHLYCKRIVHWNLPSNPIDFEQREGRIHRFQGLVIRRNLADKYAHKLSSLDVKNNVWEQVFIQAQEEKKSAAFPCDLVPFWHTETVNDIKIERFVPLYPFSRDIEKYSHLIKVLTFYRLTFGQPRQEELVEALSGYGFSEEMIKQLDDLKINLSPIKF
jgi:hypothetical protein